jgi:hypothetical protein
MKLEFSRQIFKKMLKYQISWKSAHWEESCSMLTDGQSDMTKLTVAFRNFAKAPKGLATFVMWTKYWQKSVRHWDIVILLYWRQTSPHVMPVQAPRGGGIVVQTLAPEIDRWSTPRPGRFTPRKTQYPLCRRLGDPEGRSGQEKSLSPPPGFCPQTAQFFASDCTDWAILAAIHLQSIVAMYVSCGRAVEGVGLRPLTCWDWGFESHRGNGRLSCECCVLSGRGLCVGSIHRLEESHRGCWCRWTWSGATIAVHTWVARWGQTKKE